MQTQEGYTNEEIINTGYEMGTGSRLSSVHGNDCTGENHDTEITYLYACMHCA